MGREIRRVPEGWEHPRNERGDYQPMMDRTFDEALSEWLEEYDAVKAGKDEYYDSVEEYLQDTWVPQPKYYRPAWNNATWYQMYETVSEGTPVSPVFETKEELAEYLIEHGDFWDQRRGHGGWQKEYAYQFVEREFAMSGFINTGTGEFRTPRTGS